MGTPFIVITLNSKIVERRRLDKELTTIGRAQENDIVINNPAVSRFHTIIYRKGDKVVIKDLESANGTFVNGKRVDTAELVLGDVMLIGKYALIYKEGALKPEDNPDLEDEGTVMVSAEAQEKFLKRLKNDPLKTPKLILAGGKEIEIKTDPFTIGKGGGSNLKIDGVFVKSPHARIVRHVDGTYKIISVDSFLTSTKVNGTVIKEKILQDGDIIQIGKYEMVFSL